MTIVDEAGRKSTSTLTIEVSAGGPDPRIVWVGHDIKKRYNTATCKSPDRCRSASRRRRACSR